MGSKRRWFRFFITFWVLLCGSVTDKTLDDLLDVKDEATN